LQHLPWIVLLFGCDETKIANNIRLWKEKNPKSKYSDNQMKILKEERQTKSWEDNIKSTFAWIDNAQKYYTHCDLMPRLVLQKLKECTWENSQSSKFTKITTLEDGLKEMYQNKMIDGSGFSLPCQCNKNQRDIVVFEKQMIVAPKVLMIHLNRSDFGSNGKQVKSKHVLNYPEILEFGAPQQKYELIGVCVHSGSTNQFGHYYAYVKNMHNNSWYKANDESVQQSTIDNASQTNDAMVLIYQPHDPQKILTTSASDEETSYWNYLRLMTWE